MEKRPRKNHELERPVRKAHSRRIHYISHNFHFGCDSAFVKTAAGIVVKRHFAPVFKVFEVCDQ